MSVTRARLGVLVSGSGSNLQALLDACAQEGFPAEVATEGLDGLRGRLGGDGA